MITLVKDKDTKKLEEAASHIIAQSIVKIIQHDEKAVLAIPGGRSVAGIFSRLKEEKDVDWKKVHIFMVDERLVPLDDENSNFKLANETFIKDLVKSGKLPEENVHPFKVNKKKKDFGVKDYEMELRGVHNHYDIILLSSGEDGHVGCLYPNHHSIKENNEDFVFMEDSPKPPKNRMGISKRMLLRSRVSILLFFGEAKRHAFNKFMDPKTEQQHCPNTLVRKINHSYVLTDLV